MWREKEWRNEGWRVKCEIQSLAPETARLCRVQFGPARASCSTLLGLQRPPPPLRPASRLFATSSSAISSSFSLARMPNGERERLVNEAHAHTLARTRSVPSSPFPCVVPPALPLVSLLRHYLSAAASACFFLRRRRGLKHNAPRCTA